MTSLPILNPPAGSTALDRLTELNPDDPTFSNASLMSQLIAVGAVYEATQEDSVNQIKAEVQTCTDAIHCDSAAGQLWNIRDQIMKAGWPSDPTWQAKLIADLDADTAVPCPAQPILPPPAISLQTWTADDAASAQVRAQKILDDLNAAQQDSVTSGKPMEQFLASPNGDLISSVARWLTAQGLDYMGDPWTKTLLDTGSGYTSVDKTSLTTTWDIATPAIMYMSDQPANELWYHDTNGNVRPISLQDTPQVRGATFWASQGYDTSLLPANLRNSSFAMGFPYAYKFFADPDGTKHLMLDPSVTSFTIPELQWPTSDPNYQDIAPAMASLGVDAGSNSRYWSDGTNIYKLDYSDPTQLAEALGNTHHYDSDTSLFAQMVAFAAQTGPEVQKVLRVPGIEDAPTLLARAEQTVQTLDNASTNWSALAQAQLINLQEAFSKYSNGTNWLTDAAQRREHMLTTWADRI